jgi:hypothetical protein
MDFFLASLFLMIELCRRACSGDVSGHRRNVSRVAASRLRVCRRQWFAERLAAADLMRRIV